MIGPDDVLGESIEFAGAAGFIEESLREENQNDEIDDVPYEEYLDYMESTNPSFKLLYNANPALAKHIIKRFVESNTNTVEKQTDDDLSSLYEEMEEEIKDLEKII